MISDILAERRQRRQQFERATGGTSTGTTTDPTARTDADADAEKAGTVDVGGDVLEVDTAETVQTFQSSNSLLTSDEFGFPRGAEVVAGRELGQTPLMELTKNVIANQLTGGDLALPMVEDNPPAALEEFRDTVQGLIARGHVGGMDFDDLVTAFVSDAVDVGWGYWEVLPTADNSVPVAQLKPVDALTIQHNLTDEGQFADDGPAFYHAPTAATASGSLTPVELQANDPKPLDADELVMLRAPGTARSNDPYGTPPAVKAREWLEIVTNATADINRDYDDTQIPEGVFQTEGGAVDDLTTQLRQSRGDKRKAPIVDYEVDWVDVGYDTTETRIAEQEWFWKMVMAMFGYNRNEVGMTENTGLGTETPAQATLIYKKITKPFLTTIEQAIRGQLLPLWDQYDGQFDVAIQNTDPRQEIVEQEEARKRFVQGTNTYADMKQELGEDLPDDTTITVGDTEVDWANQPKWVFDQIVRVLMGDPGQAGSVGTESMNNSATIGEDDVTDPAAFIQQVDADVDPDAVARRLNQNRKQLEDTIEVQSSFLVATAYDRQAEFMQLEFEREGKTNAIYWYGGVPEFRFFNFLRADSKGQYFNRYIRGEYDYARVQ